MMTPAVFAAQMETLKGMQPEDLERMADYGGLASAPGRSSQAPHSDEAHQSRMEEMLKVGCRSGLGSGA